MSHIGQDDSDRKWADRITRIAETAHGEDALQALAEGRKGGK